MTAKAAFQRFEEMGRGPGPVLLATDLDGTLAPIVDRPEGARVPEETLRLLERLSAVCRVAVVTGRDLNTARLLVPVADVIVIGSHGLEASIEHELLPTFDRTRLAAALERVEEQVINAVPAIYPHIERKAISTAFHFRDAPHLAVALDEALAHLPDELMLRRGKMVLEVVPKARGGKDRALLALADRFRSRGVVVVGDDVTDVAMFRAAHDLRERGTAVLVVGVTGGTETPDDLVDLSDVVLASTDDVVRALTVLAETLERRG